MNMQNLLKKSCRTGLIKLVAKCIEHGVDPTVDDNYAIKRANYNRHVAVV